MSLAERTPSLAETMLEMGTRARAAAQRLANAATADKNAALNAMATQVRAATPDILKANASDIDLAERNNRPAAFIDRLMLDEARIEAIAAALEATAGLPDPVGAVMDQWTRPNGLDISRVRTPIGVIGIIYESRPNVTADAGALCMKAGNAAILRSGSDSLASAMAIADCLRRALVATGLPQDAIQIVGTGDRGAVGHMLAGLDGAIDVIVPRGGKSLVGRVQSEARVPVFAHLEGICHVFVHADADTRMARDIVLNSKMRRTGICGAAECVLIDKAGASQHLAAVIDVLAGAGCEVRGDAAVQAADARVVAATDQDFGFEFLAPIIAMRVVDGIGGALNHIRQYGSAHTDCIVTNDDAAAKRFQKELDSAIVLHNASTQFADGGEFGFGAEIGIATGKMHARGPVGLEQLTSFKYCLSGTGQTRP